MDSSSIGVFRSRFFVVARWRHNPFFAIETIVSEIAFRWDPIGF